MVNLERSHACLNGGKWSRHMAYRDLRVVELGGRGKERSERHIGIGEG